MPDAPISTTPRISLGQWGEKKKPGASALNANWQKVDDAVAALQDAIESIDFSGKADQSSLDALSAALDDLEAAIAAANYVKADGTIPMEADLNADGNKVVGLANGVDANDAATVGQLEAAVAAGLGSLSGSYAYVLAKNSADLTGDSPKTFEADTHVSISNAGLHSTSSNKDRFVATQDGFWILTARLKVTSMGGAELRWKKNGTEAVESIMPTALHDTGEGTTFITDFLLIQLAAGDYVTLDVYGLVAAEGTIKADSTVAMFLLAANAVGGGDFKADGSVPMTGDLDLGGNKVTGAGDAVDPTDVPTLQQVEDLIQVVQDEVDAISAGQLVVDEKELTGGDQSIPGTSWTDITGSAMVKTFATSKQVALDAEGSAAPDFLRRSNLQLGIKVQKTGDAAVIYPGTIAYSTTLGNWMQNGMTVHKKLSLTAGEWSFSLVARQIAALGASTALYKNADTPARLGITYTN